MSDRTKRVAKPFLSRRNGRRAAGVGQGRFAALAPPPAVLRILDQRQPPADSARHEKKGGSEPRARMTKNPKTVTHLSAGQFAQRTRMRPAGGVLTA